MSDRLEEIGRKMEEAAMGHNEIGRLVISMAMMVVEVRELRDKVKHLEDRVEAIDSWIYFHQAEE